MSCMTRARGARPTDRRPGEGAISAGEGTLEPAHHLGGYRLGTSNPANGYAEAIGNTGQLPGYMSWAACLPEDQAVIVVLTNHEVADGHLAYSHGLARPLVDALHSS